MVIPDCYMYHMFGQNAAATIVAGSSFSGLRSNQRAYNYFLTPASIPEKFIFEFTFRVILFTLLFPLIYWLVFHVEGYLLDWIEPAFAFQPVTFFDAFHLPTTAENNWMKLFVFSQGLLFLTVPFFEQFFNEILPEFVKQANLLNISIAEITDQLATQS